MKNSMLLHKALWILVAAFLVLMATEQLRAELPPAAQEAFDKGVIAAKQQEWEIAIQSFQEARKTAPDAPELFYNLGLAESKLSGRELRAITWLGAYLAASPNAPNAASVRDLIINLDVKSESNISHLIKLFQDTSNQTAWDKDSVLYHVADLWIEAGNAARATEAADLMSHRDDFLAFHVVSVQAQAGDFADAQRRADHIEDSDYKNRAEWEIAVAQAEAGNFVGARKTAELITPARVYMTSSSKADTEEIIDKIQRKQWNRHYSNLNVSVSGWVKETYSLNEPIYTDIAKYLKSLPADDHLLTALENTAKTVISKHKYIHAMLKQQARR
jgi:tetratricopeptide (TPR) repeat protein